VLSYQLRLHLDLMRTGKVQHHLRLRVIRLYMSTVAPMGGGLGYFAFDHSVIEQVRVPRENFHISTANRDAG
jgi:hypothetical protein